MMTGKNPLVTIIIPCYNVAPFVVKAVSSILYQTYTNLEVLIIDDGSTDDTLEKIKTFQDDRIKVISLKENTQKVGAVNEALKQSNGDYIAFQDADDWSEAERIEAQLSEFKRDLEIGICFTGYRYALKQLLPAKQISLTNDELKEEFLNYTYKREAGTSPTLCGTMMISKAALIKTGGYHPFFAGRVGEDIHWVYRILKDFKGITINKVLYSYTIRKGSFTQIQSLGIKPKYAYSWQLISKIIYKDIHEGIDVLAPKNAELLKKIQLEACEEALAEKIQVLEQTKFIYESSGNFKVGKLILKPIRFILSLKPTK
jgi:glycosyltransferase involved in cell wall biosynthesis